MHILRRIFTIYSKQISKATAEVYDNETNVVTVIAVSMVYFQWTL